MSANWDLYTKRLSIDGNSVKEKQINYMKDAITNDFQNDPSYFLAQRNSIPINIRLIEDAQRSSRIDFIKTILLEPGEILTLGDVFALGSDKWLCVEVDPLHEVYYKGSVRLCNATFTLQTSTTKTITGYDSLGRPIYTEVPVITSWNCIAETKYINANFDKPINLPENKIHITVPYSDLIKENMEFNMWNNKYKITGFSMENVINGIGILKVWSERMV